MACDGIADDDRLEINHTRKNDNAKDKITEIQPEETNELEEFIETISEAEQEIYKEEKEDNDVIEEVIEQYNAENGSEETVDMNKYYYKDGSMTKEAVKELLQNDIMKIYNIREDDTDKETKLQQAYSDIIEKTAM